MIKDLPDYTKLISVNVEIPEIDVGPVNVGYYKVAPADLPDGTRTALITDVKGRLIVVQQEKDRTVETAAGKFVRVKGYATDEVPVTFSGQTIDVGRYNLAPADLADNTRTPLLTDIKGRPIVVIYGAVSVTGTVDISTLPAILESLSSMWYDRSPLDILKSFEGLSLAPHSQAQRWVYTVPDLCKAYVELLCGELYRTVAPSSGVADASIIITLQKSSSAVEEVVAFTTICNATVGTINQFHIPQNMVLYAKDIIRAYTLDNNAGGAITYRISMKATEFSRLAVGAFTGESDIQTQIDLTYDLTQISADGDATISLTYEVEVI